MARIFGIDLGTTNSCIAWLQDGVPKVVSIENEKTVPSVVSFDGEEIIVGRKAVNRTVAFPEETVASVKRAMGREETIDVAGRSLPPEKISSYILSFLKDEAGKILGEDVTNAVITVPAYFSDSQRRLTRQAGEMAGLVVERIVNEPTAAALFYDLTLPRETAKEDRNVLVYDLGGGTFDVSVLRMGEITEVLASTGNTLLGGDDFDKIIVDKCLDTIRKTHGTDLASHKPALARLKMAAERAKISLSAKVDATIEEDLLPVPQGDPVSLKLDISREDFESWIAPYLDQTSREIRSALKEAKLEAGDIDQCVLVGGSTRIPAVVEQVASFFGGSRLPVIDPDLCVAKGAAVQGGIISGEHCEQVLIDVTAHTLGTKAFSGNYLEEKLIVVPIIPRNSQIPTVKSQRFHTRFEDQERIQVTVYQGESEEPDENTLIGEIYMNLVPSPAQTPIVIEFGYDLDGIIHVRVEQQGYGKIKEVDFSAHMQGQGDLEVDIMDDEEFDDMSDDADDTDVSGVTNYILQKGRQLLATLSEDERETLAGLVERYAEALTSDDEDLVDDIEEELVDFMDDLEDA